MRPQPNDDETLDQVAGDWLVFQLRKGHRFSTDDQVVAWRAAAAMPNATRVLDMGCGIGSVGLMTLHLLESEPPMDCIEAQDLSVGLYTKSLEYNALQDRITLHHGDLRDSAALLGDATFDLITGSPPYAPVGTCLISPHPQKAACRVELRGSVIDYGEAARRHLAPGGRFAYVMLAKDPRTEQAAAQNGMVILERTDIVFRDGSDPLIAVIVAAREEDGPFGERGTGTLTVRTSDGEWTDEYRAIRQSFLDARTGSPCQS